MEMKVQFTFKYVVIPNNFMRLLGRIQNELVSIAIDLTFKEKYIDIELANRLEIAK
jgi:hypothetical protein